jgi:hypothetical protein
MDLQITIHQTLLTFNNSPKLVELLEFKDCRVLVHTIITEKWLLEKIVLVELGESQPYYVMAPVVLILWIKGKSLNFQ